MTKKVVYQAQESKKKSKLLQAYEKLLADISLKQKQQKNFSEGIRVLGPKLKTELNPLVKELLEWEIKKMVRLDEVFGQVVVSNAKALLFTNYMEEMLGELLENADKSNTQLNELYKKYTKKEFKSRLLEQFQYYADILSQQMGKEINPDELMDKGIEQFILENKENLQAKNQSRKKSKKQTKQEQENELLALDAKAIYFRLIKKYHPDLQQDPVKQREHTEISKLVTKAYKENDFMALLRLQITYLEDHDQEATTLADDMLNRYNKILRNQLADLNAQINMAKHQSDGMFEDFFDKNYTFSTTRFNQKKRELEINLEDLKSDLEESYKQKKGWFKDFLKEIKVDKEMEELLFLFKSNNR
jgi:hypothetical protein